jgi:hypothetical protein
VAGEKLWLTTDIPIRIQGAKRINNYYSYRRIMNSKKAKKLRKRARGMTVGMPNTEYVTGMNGATLLTEMCTRSVYKQLKREYMEKKREK